jgi:hypothetical protein
MEARRSSLDRGRVVAELRRPSVTRAPGGVEEAIERLAAEGVVTPGLPQDPAAYGRTGVRLSGDSQSLLDDERGER